MNYIKTYAKVVKYSMSTKEALVSAIGQEHPMENTPWLALADHMEELGHNKRAERIRWWVKARKAMQEGINWNGTASEEEATNIIDRLPSARIRNLAAVDMNHHINENWPINNPEVEETVKQLHHGARIATLEVGDYNHLNQAYDRMAKLGSSDHRNSLGLPSLSPEHLASYTAADVALSYQPGRDLARKAARHATERARVEREGPEATNRITSSARHGIVTGMQALHDFIRQNPPPTDYND